MSAWSRHRRSSALFKYQQELHDGIPTTWTSPKLTIADSGEFCCTVTVALTFVKCWLWILKFWCAFHQDHVWTKHSPPTWIICVSGMWFRNWSTLTWIVELCRTCCTGVGTRGLWTGQKCNFILTKQFIFDQCYCSNLMLGVTLPERVCMINKDNDWNAVSPCASVCSLTVTNMCRSVGKEVESVPQWKTSTCILVETFLYKIQRDIITVSGAIRTRTRYANPIRTLLKQNTGAQLHNEKIRTLSTFYSQCWGLIMTLNSANNIVWIPHAGATDHERKGISQFLTSRQFLSRKFDEVRSIRW